MRGKTQKNIPSITSDMVVGEGGGAGETTATSYEGDLKKISLYTFFQKISA